MRLFYIMIIFSLSLNSQSSVESINYDEYLKISKTIDFLIVDVRTPEEYQISRIKNSININFYDKNFINVFKNLDFDKHILIYCRSGRRSLEAVKILSDEGFRKLYDLKGGVLALDKSIVDFDSL